MTKSFYRIILNFSAFVFVPMFAHAAGTYLNGAYRSPQQNYSQMAYAPRQQQSSYTQDTTYTRTRTISQNPNAYVGQPYQGYTRVVGTQQQFVNQPRQSQSSGNTSSQKTGLFLNAGVSHEFANWKFDMKSAGSILQYDNLRWNIFDAVMGYRFNAGNTPLQLDAGVRYGMQFGDSPMVDDDITNGGYFVTEWWNDVNSNQQYDPNVDEYIGQQLGHALSVGTTDSGDLLGLHAGFGLTDFLKFGGARVTPSIGFRYLKYKLDSKRDYGLTVDTGYCTNPTGSDEIQCDPIVIIKYASGQQVLWNEPVDDDGFWTIVSGAEGVSTGGTYMFLLPGVGHSYETTWMGPYIALDLNYDINAYNAVNARMEFGLPTYTSTGDQPYRVDWQHPKSVEDKGGFGDAWHVGFGANYMTALTDSVMFTLGFTFDYYSLSGGEASTYLNSDYYLGIYNEILANYIAAGLTVDDMLNGYTSGSTTYGPNPTAVHIKNLQSECPGWVCKVDNEIESIYKSMGIRVGIQAKF
jgi:hypothetical protein